MQPLIWLAKFTHRLRPLHGFVVACRPDQILFIYSPSHPALSQPSHLVLSHLVPWPSYPFLLSFPFSHIVYLILSNFVLHCPNVYPQPISLRYCYSCSCEPFFFERCVPTKGAWHLHVQAVPIPSGEASRGARILMRSEGSRHGMTFDKVHKKIFYISKIKI